jgi:hypothetical protein
MSRVLAHAICRSVELLLTVGILMIAQLIQRATSY